MSAARLISIVTTMGLLACGPDPGPASASATSGGPSTGETTSTGGIPTTSTGGESTIAGESTSSTGAETSTGAQSDASSGSTTGEPVCACAADQICVQFFDGVCGPGQLTCVPNPDGCVPDECSPACQALCGSSTCDGPPCPGEVAAALQCYGH